MVSEQKGNPLSVGAEIEAGWMIIASTVSSLPKEELEGQKFDFLVLWTADFGGNLKNQLERAERMLSLTLSRWSAALDALTAFLESFVMPNMSPLDEGIVLQPLLSYLSRALVYLKSDTLQQALPGLKSAINIFTIRILRAYRAITDPFLYKLDHAALLSICSAPFRDPAHYGESSCLRHLLDSRDASLGPWIPGRDSFEDELRAFEGSEEGLLPCIWATDEPVFPQRLPLADVVLDEMLLCFGNLFAAEMEQGKLVLLEFISEAFRAGKKQPWHGANMTNTCVALLAGLKASVGMQRGEWETNALLTVQEILQGVLAESVVSIPVRRAASEGLGILARLGSAAYAARLIRFLQSNAGTPPNSPLKASIALALGCVHRSVGGMALSSLVPVTVQTLCSLAKDPTDGLYFWSLHGLWLTADAAGLTYVPHVQATLSLAMELIVSEEHASPELGQSIGRLINAVVAVLGPELSPGSSLFTRCKAVVTEIGTENEPASLLETVLFTQQLALFAPLAVPVHAHVNTLRPTLTARQPSLRQAAASTFRHLSERDAVAMCEERIEEDLFTMLDNETDESIIRIVRSTLERLLEEACPSLPSRWLNLCRKVVLATSNIKSADTDFQDFETGNEDIGDDDHGMISDKTSVGLSGAASKIEDKDQLPRFKTRVFAAECLCRLPVLVGANPAHFNLVLAKERQQSGDWLVLHLGELVAVAYQIATGTLERVRPMGVELLDTILDKFAETQDPLSEGDLLVRQYQAQLVSAVRSALDAAASPLLVASGCRLAARIITSGNATGDRALLQRIVTLLTQSLWKWDDIVNANYAEWIGCKVQVSLLGAHAAVKVYGFGSSDAMTILPLLANHASILRPQWIGLLRDYTALRLHTPEKLPSTYVPFLAGIQIVTIAQSVHQYLSEVWPVVLEAVTVDASPASAATSLQEDESDMPAVKGVQLTVEDFCQVWALPLLVLNEQNGQAVSRMPGTASFASVNPSLLTADPELGDQLAALSALQHLCSKEFYTPDMLSVDLCQELIQIVSTLNLKEVHLLLPAVLAVLEKIVKLCPQVYMESKHISIPVVELCLDHIFQHLRRDKGVETSDDVLLSAMQILGNVAGKLDAEGQGPLLPRLLSAGMKLLDLVSVDGPLPSSALGFVISVTAAIASSTEGVTLASEEFSLSTRASVLAATVESLAQSSTQYSEQAMAEEGDERLVSIKRSRIFLEAMIAMVEFIPDVTEASLKGTAQERCISCLRSFLSNSNVQIRLATLQSLRTVAQAKSTEQPVGESHKWTVYLLCELGADIMQSVHSSTQESLTTASAAAVGESLKVLILLHSLVQGDEAQINVLHLLLPVIVASATAKSEDGNLQATTVLRTAALKLVTHLASVPSSAKNFRAVLLDLPPESRQQLQAIIKASMPQQTPNTSISSPAHAHLQLSKPLLPIGGGKPFLPLPTSSSQPPGMTAKSIVSTDDFSDDDWDDFQHDADTSSVPISDKSETGANSQSSEKNFHRAQAEEEQAMSHIAPEAEPSSVVDENDDDWDDFQHQADTTSVSATGASELEGIEDVSSTAESGEVNLPVTAVGGHQENHHSQGGKGSSAFIGSLSMESREEELIWNDDEDSEIPNTFSDAVSELPVQSADTSVDHV